MDEDRRETDSGIELRPVYGPEDLAGFDPERDLASPGGVSRLTRERTYAPLPETEPIPASVRTS